MKAIWSALAVGVLLWPAGAQAQGYPGVMPAQSGYRPPVQSTAPQTGANGFGSPYAGTGANGNLGYYSPGGGTDSEAAPAPEGVVISGNGDDDDDAQMHTGSAYQALFAPKPKDDDGTAPTSLYDSINTNGSSAVERRRQAILRKVEAEQRKAQRQMQRANEEHDAEVRAMVQKTVDDQRRKNHADDDEDADDDQSSDDGAADQNQPAP